MQILQWLRRRLVQWTLVLCKHRYLPRCQGPSSICFSKCSRLWSQQSCLCHRQIYKYILVEKGLCESYKTNNSTQRSNNLFLLQLTEKTCVGELCLVGTDSSSGNVYVRGKPVCDDSWSINDAHVVCKEMGFSAGASRATTKSEYDILKLFT